MKDKQKCGYLHYDDPDRPCFGRHQVRHLCQIKKDVHIEDVCIRHHHALDVTKSPYIFKEKWYFDARDGNNPNAKSKRYSLSKYNVVPNKTTGLWENSEYWLSFHETEMDCGNHNCYHV